MGLKSVFFLLALFLLITTRVSSNNEEFLKEAQAQSPVKAPAAGKVPVEAPAPVLPVKPPMHLAPPAKALAPVLPVKPPMSPPPVKAPAPGLPVKPPMHSAPPVQAPPTKPPPKTRRECIPLCIKRCKLHSRKKVCLRACMTCCDRCKCVPPGTYGNRDKCGKCYTDMTTRYGKPKCP